MKLELANQKPSQNASLKINVVFEEDELNQEATPYGVVLDLKGCNIEGDIGRPHCLPRLYRSRYRHLPLQKK